MGIIRDSFVMFKNWAESIEALPEEYQLESYKALSKYGLTGEFPEGLSPVVKAILISFSIGMENNIARYNTSVENGKKGGRPPKSDVNKLDINNSSQDEIVNKLDTNNFENVSNFDEKNFEEKNVNNYSNQNFVNNSVNAEKIEDYEETNLNLEKPNKTQQNLDKPTQNLNVNVNDNNLFVNNNTHACVREEIVNKSENDREPYIKFFNEIFDYYKEGKYYDSAVEIIDTMIDARSQAINGFKFNHKTYSEKELLQIYLNLDNEKFRKIVTQITLNEEIVDRPRYIMGCVFNVGKKESVLNTKTKLKEFEHNLGGDNSDI